MKQIKKTHISKDAYVHIAENECESTWILIGLGL